MVNGRKRRRQKWRCFFHVQKEEMGLDMEVTLAKIMALLKIIHNENMTMYRMILGRKSDEIIFKYDEQFEEILKMDIDTEK